MAQYVIEHSCGHQQTHRLFGPHKERDSRREWLLSTLCTECYRANEVQDARLVTERAGLETLTGSEKQIAWAEKIRAKFISNATSLNQVKTVLRADADQFNAGAAWLKENPLTTEQQGIINEGLQKAVPLLLVDWAKGKTSAAWWIDNQSGAFTVAAKEICEDAWAAMKEFAGKDEK